MVREGDGDGTALAETDHFLEASVRRPFLAVGVLGVAIAGPVTAQDPSDCEAAAAAVASGSHEYHEWYPLRHCEDQIGAAVSTALRASRTETDTIYLGALSAVAAAVRDTAITSAAREVATDPAATLAARITAELVAIAQLVPGLLPGIGTGWSNMLTAVPGEKCYLSAMGLSFVSENPVPSDFEDGLIVHLREVADDVSAPEPLRDLARCAYQMGGGLHRPLPPAMLDLEYVCANEFRVHNTSQWVAHVSFVVEGTWEQVEMTVGPHSFKSFSPLFQGPTVLYTGDVMVERLENPGTPCP